MLLQLQSLEKVNLELLSISNTYISILAAFAHSLERKGWEVHSQLEHHSVSGPPLEKFQGTPFEKEEHVLETLKKLPDAKRALVLMNSHVGGHKYVGNCIVRIVLTVPCWYHSSTSFTLNRYTSPRDRVFGMAASQHTK